MEQYSAHAQEASALGDDLATEREKVARLEARLANATLRGSPSPPRPPSTPPGDKSGFPSLQMPSQTGNGGLWGPLSHELPLSRLVAVCEQGFTGTPGSGEAIGVRATVRVRVGVRAP